MKKILTVFLVLIFTFLETSAYANEEISETHSHCICGVGDCAEIHAETVNWQAWNGDTGVGTAAAPLMLAALLSLGALAVIRKRRA